MHYELNYSQGDDDVVGKIDSCLYSPGPVSTKLNGLPYIPIFVPTPIQAAKSTIVDFGRFKFTNGSFMSAIIYYLMLVLDRYLSFAIDLVAYPDGVGRANQRRKRE